MIAFEDKMRAGGSAALAEVGRFFMKNGAVHLTLRAMAPRLDAMGVKYAVVGGMALVAHGYERTTVDVDILVTQAASQIILDRLDESAYIPVFPGSRNLRDTQTGVRIEFLIAGKFPGDGKPKPVAFPDPAQASVEIDGIRYLKLEKLIEIKLASGLSNSNRLKDLADVQELIRFIHPLRDLGNQLDPSVRAKYFEFWDGLAAEGPEPD